MNRGAYLLATGSPGVEDRFVRKIMLLLDRISGGGTKHKRKRGFTPVTFVTKCKCKFKSVVLVFNKLV